MHPPLRSKVICDSTAIIGECNLIGVPSEESIRGKKVPLTDVSIAARCILKNFITIHEGAFIGEDAIIEDYCRIGANSRIGPQTRVIYGAYICDDVRIGLDCRVAGFLCDDVVVEDRCTVMGTFVHDYNQPHRGWWDVTESAASVRHDTIVGVSATVVGSIILGPYSYVAAGALVTRDVPPWHIAVSQNRFLHWKEWPGKALRELFAYWEKQNVGDVR